MTDTTNQEVGGSEPAPPSEGVDTEALVNDQIGEGQTDETEADDLTDEEREEAERLAAEAETEEIEHDGKKLRIPKAIKPLLMMQADYTKKTQEVAAQRNEVAQARASLDMEAAQRRQAIAQEETLVREHAAELVTLKTVSSQLAEYEKLTPQDWANIRANDPAEADNHWFTYQQLKDARDRAISSVNTKAQELDQARQQQAANQAQHSAAYLAREIPEWGQDTYVKLGSVALEFGYQPNEVQEVMKSDPRAFKGLHEIVSLRAKVAALESAAQKNTTAKTAQQKVAASQAAAPVPKVGGSTPPTRKRIEDMSPEEYQSMRQAQERQKRTAGGRFR